MGTIDRSETVDTTPLERQKGREQASPSILIFREDIHHVLHIIDVKIHYTLYESVYLCIFLAPFHV